MDNMREALEDAIKYIAEHDTVDPMEALARGEGYSKDAQPVIDQLCSALSAPVASDARELIREIERDSVAIHRTGAYKAAQLAEDNAVMKTEAFVAQRERRVREETSALYERQYEELRTWNAERSTQERWMDMLARHKTERAAIKEVGNGKA